MKNIQIDPHMGDYVICKENLVDDNFKDFLANNIGQIVGIKKYAAFTDIDYFVRYTNIPKKFQSYFITNKDIYRKLMSRNEILDISKTKDELEAKIAVKKYNL